MTTSVMSPEMTESEPQLYRLSVEQYHGMIREGILKNGDPTELLEGLLVRKMTKDGAHRFATQYLRDVFLPMLPTGCFVDAKEPITTKDSEPEPDLGLPALSGEQLH